MLFEISEAEIAIGGHTSTNCPILRAIRSKTGNNKLYCTTLGLKKQLGGKVIYKWPINVYQWILRYDSNKKVLPFTLEIPDSILGISNKSEE